MIRRPTTTATTAVGRWRPQPSQNAPAPAAPPPQPGGSSAELCAVCATPRTGQFCEGCGRNHALPAPPPPAPAARAVWVAVVRADRDYFEAMAARNDADGGSGLSFPPYSPERRVPMTGRGQLRIGRRSVQRGTVPEIDLSTAPEDPGASRQHALLQEQPDGGWVVIDQDSVNGTTLNGSPDALPAHQPVPLRDGDRIHVGAWTTITVHHS
jgi:hypothetical protein